MQVPSEKVNGSRSHVADAYRAQLLDAVGHSIIATDLEGTITYWNDAAEELFGWTAEEAVGQNVVDVTAADTTRDQAAEIMESLLEGQSWSGEFLVKRRDGTPFPVRVTDTPIYDGDGNLVGIVGVSTDITAEKEREQALVDGNAALHKSERRLQALLKATAQVAWTADEEGNGEELGDTWSSITGQSEQEASGWGWAQAIHPDDQDRVIEGWKTHVREKTTCEVECRIRSHDGQFRWSAVRTVPVFDEQGEFVEWVGTCSDIHARKMTEAALRKSEARHRTMVDTAHEGIWLIDADANTVLVNARISELLGYSPEEIKGRPLFDFILADDLALVREKFKRRREGISESYDVRFRCRDGSVKWALVTASPYYEDSGAFAGALGMVTDITERKEAEGEVIESRSRYARLVNHIDGIVWEGSVDLAAGGFKFTLVSDRVRKILGYDPQSWIDDASNWVKSIHHEDRSWAPAACMQASRDRQDHALEYRMVGADGRVVWLRDLVRVVEADGDVVTSAGVMFDITERKDAEKALLDAKEKAEELARLKSAFLANMSHEIRTPLTSIIGYAEILEVEPPEDVESMAHHIRDAGERLMLTLDSVMDLAQLESGSLRLHLIELDVAEHLRELLPMFERHARQNGLSLDLESEHPQMRAYADAGALFRVLTNLIGNALKFTAEGGVKARITEEGDFVCVEVSDTGIGIAKDFQTRLFDDFKQESEGFSRDYEGVGLGLSITKRLVELMDGSIDVRSKKDAGSTFYVRLPRHAPGVKGAKPESRKDPASRSRRASILAVEDQEDAQYLIRHLLRSKYDVDMAVTAADALETTKERRYDLILMDINLGVEGKNGTQVLHELRARPDYEDVPVIACTAYVLPGDEERFLAEGFDAYLGKPFRKADLYSLIEKLLAEGKGVVGSG